MKPKLAPFYRSMLLCRSKSFRLALLTFALSFSILPGRADTFASFHFSGDAVDRALGQYNVTATMNLDTTTGVVTSLLVDRIDYSFFPDYLRQFNLASGFTDVSGSYACSPGNSCISGIDLILPVNSLVGYQGGEVCSLASACPYVSSYELNRESGGEGFINGAMSPVPTPEPSTLVLIGTGMLSVLVTARRRVSAFRTL